MATPRQRHLHGLCLGLVLFIFMACGVQGLRDVIGRSSADQIVFHGKLAARLKNAGKAAEAEAEIQKAYAAFDEARAEDDDDPQAYINFAVMLSNIHRFKESFPHFKAALKLVRNDVTATKQIEAALGRAKYSYYSMKRDKAYNEGKGNVTAAFGWAMRQLSVTERPEVTLHQLATLETMMCERNASYCALAKDHFAQATALSCRLFGEAAATARAEDPEAYGRVKCERSSCLLAGEWKRHHDVAAHEVHSGLFLYTMSVPIVGRGRDGVLFAVRSADCSALLPTSDHYLDAAENLLGSGAQDIQGVSDLAPFLSLVGFAGTSFYHWVAEAIPRLVIARTYWRPMQDSDPSSFKVWLPKGKGGKVAKFINETFEVLFKSWGLRWTTRLVEYVPGVVSSKGGAFVGWGEQPCPRVLERDKRTHSPGEGADTTVASVGCAALAHPFALTEARTAIYNALGPAAHPPTPFVLVALRGKGVAMRNYDEESFVAQVIDGVTNYPHGSFGIRTFDAAEHSFTEALSLFRSASVVVGVHGGALANILACRPGTSIVEIGFRTAAARHYQHMAAALGHSYRFVPVDADPLDRALGAANITFSINAAVRSLYAALGEQLGHAA